MPNKKRSSRQTKQRSKRATNAQSLSYANLEPRKLLASISLDGGTLSLEGSGGNDTFRINLVGTTLIARVDTPFETLRDTFTLNSVDSIEVTGRNGDDFFNNGSSVESTLLWTCRQRPCLRGNRGGYILRRNRRRFLLR